MSVEPDPAMPRSGRHPWRHQTGVGPAAAAESPPRNRWAGQLGVTVSEFVLVGLFLVGLIGVAFWAVNGINADTATTNCETALRNLKLATEQYHAENDAYPIDKTVLIDLDYVDEDDVAGWHLELTNAVTPTYTPTGACS